MHKLMHMPLPQQTDADKAQTRQRIAEGIKSSNAFVRRCQEEYADEIVRDEGVSREEALQRARKELFAKLLSPAAKASLEALASESCGTQQAQQD